MRTTSLLSASALLYRVFDLCARSAKASTSLTRVCQIPLARTPKATLSCKWGRRKQRVTFFFRDVLLHTTNPNTHLGVPAVHHLGKRDDTQRQPSRPDTTSSFHACLVVLSSHDKSRSFSESRYTER